MAKQQSLQIKPGERAANQSPCLANDFRDQSYSVHNLSSFIRARKNNDRKEEKPKRNLLCIWAVFPQSIHQEVSFRTRGDADASLTRRREYNVQISLERVRKDCFGEPANDSNAVLPHCNSHVWMGDK